jgi:hypothetical protein
LLHSRSLMIKSFVAPSTTSSNTTPSARLEKVKSAGNSSGRVESKFFAKKRYGNVAAEFGIDQAVGC